jgi:hypothetical protein
MKRQDVGVVILVGFLVLAVEFLVVASLATPNDVDPSNAAAAIAMITAAAVGIERIIELFWTAVGLIKDSWWPFGQFRKQLDTLVSGLDEVLKKFFDHAEARAEALQDAAGGKANAEHVVSQIKRVRARTEALRRDLDVLASDKQQFQLLAASAVDAVSYTERLLPEAQRDAAITLQAITGMTDFIDTFKDNPGRRLISIFIGSGIGLLVAWLLGLDVFRAVLAAPTVGIQREALFPALGVAITGMVIGLGANPTHEVIRLIQEYKKSQKTANNPSPVPANEGTSNILSGQLVLHIGNNESLLQDTNGTHDAMPRMEPRAQPTRFTSQYRRS